MSDVTRGQRSNEAHAPNAAQGAGGHSASSPRPKLGMGLLRVLTRLAGAPESGADVAAPMPRGRAPNRCEFDYDYYVALRRGRGVGAGWTGVPSARSRSNPRT